MLTPGSGSNRTAGVSALMAVGASIAAGIALIAGLFISAQLDGVLIMHRGDVGLLQHPGFFAIIFGDVVLVILTSISSKLLNAVTSSIPNHNSRSTKRVVSTIITKHWTGSTSLFFRILTITSFIGLLALLNQSIKLGNPQQYYKHDTFDSINHTYSYAFSRFVLFFSWCIIVPIFVSQAITYFSFIDITLRRLHKMGVLSFFVEHRDRNGGFAFIGYVNILFNAGLLIIIIESIILIYTHNVVSVEIIMNITLFGTMFVFFTYISTYRAISVLSSIEDAMKLANYTKIRESAARIDSYHLALNFGVRFSLYTIATERLLLSIRVAAFLPTIYKIYEYARLY